jgi:hypothetical protein
LASPTSQRRSVSFRQRTACVLLSPVTMGSRGRSGADLHNSQSNLSHVPVPKFPQGDGTEIPPRILLARRASSLDAEPFHPRPISLGGSSVRPQASRSFPGGSSVRPQASVPKLPKALSLKAFSCCSPQACAVRLHRGCFRAPQGDLLIPSSEPRFFAKRWGLFRVSRISGVRLFRNRARPAQRSAEFVNRVLIHDFDRC